jgi:hypothetical protein
MSYKDLKEAQKKRAEKDAAKAKSKGKCGRKRKSAALETNAIGPKAKVARMSKELEPVRAPVSSVQAVPVARMY